jgi:intraflagellar transport protein 22
LCSTGKTTISNYLSGNIESLSSSRYDPTNGVRILEFEKRFNGVPETINVELWDSSGDQSYEGCWKAIMHEADGIILVYNPDAPGQDQQIGDWFDFFVRKNGLKDGQCIVFAHRSKVSNDRFKPRKQQSSYSYSVYLVC